jgi:GT2 family glycosyltransferase
MKSGWHTKIENLKNNQIVDWIYTAAVVYKNKMIKNNYFDNSLGIYSYLEDLDFSLNFRKKNLRLIINCSAKIKHPIIIERNDYKFGLLEILNRHYLVKKHNLSLPSFYLGAIIRSLISLIEFFKGKFNFISRFFGNIYGILFCLFSYNKRK